MRRVKIRGDKESPVYRLEQLVRDNYKEIIDNIEEGLEETAECIESEAKDLCPVYEGREVRTKNGPKIVYDPVVERLALKNSISVRVSRSNRSVGIIASASAKNKESARARIRHNPYDYALIQEVVEFSHITGESHYLSRPFYSQLKFTLEELAGVRVELDYTEILDY
jgi:hypothetical protein